MGWELDFNKMGWELDYIGWLARYDVEEEEEFKHNTEDDEAEVLDAE